MISIIAVGKKHEDWIKGGLERYEKRLRKPFVVEWVLLPHSSLDGPAARLEESGRIRKRLPDDAYVVLLDERGVLYNSSQLSKLFEDAAGRPGSVQVVIGGAFGVDELLTQRADMIVSLSKLVFPHQLVRLILIEQLYRAQEIARGGKYHHE